MRWANKLRIVCVLLLFLLTSCSNSEELLSNLDAGQSIEVMVALGRSGLQADRVKSTSGRNPTYRILVHETDYPKALQLLHEYGLPRSEAESIESFTRPSGFVPNTPEVASLRLDHALELRIERMLTALDGVIEARAVVRTVERRTERGADSAEGPAASVIVRYSTEGQALPFDINEARQIVARAVPGLLPTDVRIQTTKVRLPTDDGEGVSLAKVFPLGIRVPVEDKQVFVFQLLALCIAFAVCGLIIGAYLSAWNWRRAQRKMQRQRARSLSGESAGRSIFIEAAADGSSRTRQSLPSVRDSGTSS